MGKRLGDAHDPLLVSVRSGAKFSMPGMMDTVLNLGLNDRLRRGPRAPDRRPPLRARLVPPLHLDVRAHRARHRRRRVRRAVRQGQGRRRARRATRACPPSGSAELVAELKAVVVGSDGRPVPPGPRRPAARCDRGGLLELGRRPRRSPTASARASRTTSAPRSTSRRWCSATATTARAPASASPATRRPGSAAPTATSSSTPRARTSSPASGSPSRCGAMRRRFPKVHAELLAIFARLERHYQRHVRHGVHDRAGPPVDAADARRASAPGTRRCAWPSR